ncbi:UNVERIFIED_CONTAM: MarR family transcriptional regulator, partial [Salmonella enterica subsp. enterica serovar Weltevreden]
EKGHMTAGELAVLTGLTTGAVTGLIDRFEKKKLVKRKFDKEDRRKVLIEPDTKKIMALLAPLYKDYRSESEKLMDSFSGKELRTIGAYLQGAIRIMNETTHQLNKQRKKDTK